MAIDNVENDTDSMQVEHVDERLELIDRYAQLLTRDGRTPLGSSKAIDEPNIAIELRDLVLGFRREEVGTVVAHAVGCGVFLHRQQLDHVGAEPFEMFKTPQDIKELRHAGMACISALFVDAVEYADMVRRDDAGARAPASRRSSPAGASPASVSAGAPSSRPQARDESRVAQAGCQESLRREQARGPQHHVKPAASTDLQPESRAGHVAAKAIPAMPQSGGTRIAGLGGVRGAARGQGEERNTRGPSVRPESGQRDSHKPPAKASAAQR